MFCATAPGFAQPAITASSEIRQPAPLTATTPDGAGQRVVFGHFANGLSSNEFVRHPCTLNGVPQMHFSTSKIGNGKFQSARISQ